MPSISIDTYDVTIYSSRPSASRPDSPMAKIMFYTGSISRGQALFYANDVTLRLPTYQQTGNKIFLYYHISQLDGILRMIKEEDPIFLFYFTSSNAGLGTGKEPVGEEES